MGKKIKIAILLLGLYLLIFGIGFKSGAMYMRMKKKMQVERLVLSVTPPPVLPALPAPTVYLIVTRHDYGSYVTTDFSEVKDDHLYIRMLNNDNFRPLLKSLDIEIYKDTGERIY